MLPPDLDALNQREFRKLVLSIKARTQKLELLLAICDDRNLQDTLITAYETELKAAGITPFQARLNSKQPSLRAALQALIDQAGILQSGDPAMVTVLNANELLGVRLTEDNSEQERFFFSLQWTREALRQFAFPVVLWLPDAIATRLSQRAPDFWSWRSGVFEFVVQSPAAPELRQSLLPTRELDRSEPNSQLPIDDLQRQIADLEKIAPHSPLLVTLYNSLGEAYEQQYRYKQALELYEQVLAMAQAKDDLTSQARAFCKLGDSLKYCGRPSQSLEFYQQALTLYRKQEDRSNEAVVLNQFGLAHDALSQYQQAIDFHQQSLVIEREISDRRGEGDSLSSLGNAYHSLGQYQQAIDFYQQSLVVEREISDRLGEGDSLGGLGNAYHSLGQYQQAIDFYQQQLTIAHEIGDRCGEANAYFNKGLALAKLHQTVEAQESFAAARTVYEALELSKMVKNCNEEIQALSEG